MLNLKEKKKQTKLFSVDTNGSSFPTRTHISELSLEFISVGSPWLLVFTWKKRTKRIDRSKYLNPQYENQFRGQKSLSYIRQVTSDPFSQREFFLYYILIYSYINIRIYTRDLEPFFDSFLSLPFTLCTFSGVIDSQPFLFHSQILPCSRRPSNWPLNCSTCAIVFFSLERVFTCKIKWSKW